MIVRHPELIYFDNGATTLKPQCVIDAVTDFYCEHTSNVHRGDYAIAALNDRLYDGTRNIFAKLINCDPKEIVFTHNATASLNQIVAGIGAWLKEGDTVMLTKAEHASNLLPWFALAKAKNLKVEYIPTDVIETGFTLNTDDANTCIRVTHKLPVANATSVGRPEYKGTKSTQYIYPGRTFWISNGVLDETTNEWYGFSKLPVTKTNGDN